jgi:hypothetical protein
LSTSSTHAINPAFRVESGTSLALGRLAVDGRHSVPRSQFRPRLGVRSHGPSAPPPLGCAAETFGPDENFSRKR